jgi:peptidyl-prolyl cis-trans isomerase A (cyclophilin A)
MHPRSNRIASLPALLLGIALLAGPVGCGKDTGAPSEQAAKPSGPVVVITTAMGAITVQLDPRKAPVTTKNFLEYVNAGFYDGTTFHRVIPTFMIQGGGFTKDLTEKPTRAPIKNEATNGLSNRRGTIAMARTGDPNSATSQFFINVKDNPSLDYGVRDLGYAVFGEVIEGMDVVDKIRFVPTHDLERPGMPAMEAVPVEPVIIESVKVKK